MILTHTKVRFIYRPADLETKKPAQILTGKIKEHTKEGGYLIKIEGDKSIKSLDGTLCNRGEKDIIEVLS